MSLDVSGCPVWVKEQRIGYAFLLAFIAALLGIWAAAPIQALISEHVLGNIGYQNEEGFSPGFGAFPELVKDQGGAQPVPIEPDAPLRSAQYHDLNWVLGQDATAITLQVAVLSSERAVADFLAVRADRDQFAYFVLPPVGSVAAAAPAASATVPVPVYEAGTAAAAPAPSRYIVTYGNFAARNQADDVAASLRGLPSAPLARAWSVYQADAKAAKAAPTAPVVVPSAPASAPTEAPAVHEPAAMAPVTSTPLVEAHVPTKPKEINRSSAHDPLQTAPVSSL